LALFGAFIGQSNISAKSHTTNWIIRQEQIGSTGMEGKLTVGSAVAYGGGGGNFKDMRIGPHSM
jgi:hypothetical protein